MNIPFNDLSRIHSRLTKDFHSALDETIKTSSFVLGSAVEDFENLYANFEDFTYCAAVDNGTNAIELALRSAEIQKDDEVILPAMTFVATAFAISRLGAKPILVDTNEDSPHLNIDLIEEAITPNTKAIIYVSLHGIAYDLEKLKSLALKHNLTLILDGAQSQGFRYLNKPMSCFFDIMTTSFYPGKNFGSLGEGGAILTNNYLVSQKLMHMRNWGAESKYNHVTWGGNFRLHALQARFLQIKLPHLRSYNLERLEIAKYYSENLNSKLIRRKPFMENHVYHVFEINFENPTLLQNVLSNKGIQTAIHYPKAIHQNKFYEKYAKVGGFPNAENFARTTLSLPIFPLMQKNEIEYVVEEVNKCLI